MPFYVFCLKGIDTCQFEKGHKKKKKKNHDEQTV